jgi:hypothetical protein
MCGQENVVIHADGRGNREPERNDARTETHRAPDGKFVWAKRMATAPTA